jgi:two-component system alkaline phosphatase synthesis response regulator PhoP
MIDVVGRILVVDDEINLAEGIKENLVAEGHEVTTVYHGRTALDTITEGDFDLILLDVMLPGLDGYSICEAIRADGDNTPVLFLTAKGEADDRVRGLEAGGDDYLPKPFHLKELLARVGAIMRRTRWYGSDLEAGSRLEFAGNEMDFRSFRGKDWNGIEQILPHREAMIFKVLAESVGEVVSREAILEKVWGYDVYPSTRTIDNFIVRLRKKFERTPEEPQHFHTVRGVGYRFTAELEGES